MRHIAFVATTLAVVGASRANIDDVKNAEARRVADIVTAGPGIHPR